MSGWSGYRRLEAGEIVRAGDEYDRPKPGEGYGWNAQTYWAEVPRSMVGLVVSDPRYPAHQMFRRKLVAETA